MEGNEPNSVSEQPLITKKLEKKKEIQLRTLITIYHLVNRTCNVF